MFFNWENIKIDTIGCYKFTFFPRYRLGNGKRVLYAFVAQHGRRKNANYFGR